MSEQTRHYIAVTALGRLTIRMSSGTGRDQFNTGPTEPIAVGETWAYPVSAEIAQEWEQNK